MTGASPGRPEWRNHGRYKHLDHQLEQLAMVKDALRLFPEDGELLRKREAILAKVKALLDELHGEGEHGRPRLGPDPLP